MHISMTADVAPGSSPRPSILRSAEIIASGFLVSATEPASARYSRLRDSAKRMTIDKIQAIAMRRMAMSIATPAPGPLATAAAPTAPANPALEQQAEDELGEKRDHPGDDHRDHQHAHVAIADVGQLVAEDRFGLGVVERIDQPRGDRDRILLVVHAGGEGVEAVILDHLELRRGDAARDAEVLEEIVEPRLLL